MQLLYFNRIVLKWKSLFHLSRAYHLTNRRKVFLQNFYRKLPEFQLINIPNLLRLKLALKIRLLKFKAVQWRNSTIKLVWKVECNFYTKLEVSLAKLGLENAWLSLRKQPKKLIKLALTWLNKGNMKIKWWSVQWGQEL